MIDGSVSIGFIHDGSVRATFFTRFTELVLFDLANNQRLFSHDKFWLQGQYGSGGIVQGRNDIARAMCETSSAEWLLWIDTDMGFDPDLADRLIDAADPVERPVVGALCFAQKNDGGKPYGARWFRTQPTIYLWVDQGEDVGFTPRFDYERDAIVQCNATGSAAILIHRTVLERMRDELGADWYTPIKHKSGTVFSEDLSFCMRLMTMGVPVFVDTSVKTTHDKFGIFLDEEQYDRERAAAKAGQPMPPPIPRVTLDPGFMEAKG